MNDSVLTTQIVSARGYRELLASLVDDIASDSLVRVGQDGIFMRCRTWLDYPLLPRTGSSGAAGTAGPWLCHVVSRQP
jgi:hypothetical protein